MQELTYQEELQNETVAQCIDNALDQIKRAYEMTTDAHLKLELRWEWDKLCGLLKRAQQLAK